MKPVRHTLLDTLLGRPPKVKRKRGRPSDENRKVKIAATVLTRLEGEKDAVRRGKNAIKYSPRTTRSMASIYKSVGKLFGVSPNVVARYWGEHSHEASRYIIDAVRKKLKAGDSARRIKRRMEMAEFQRSLAARVDEKGKPDK